MKHLINQGNIKFAVGPGFTSPDGFFTYLKNTFDVLYAEGEITPKLMNVGLHCRLVGKPARAKALQMFMDYGERANQLF